MVANMPAGERDWRLGGPRTARQNGVIYLSVLSLVMVMGIGMLQAATLWSTVRQRQNETELLFVGDQFRQAIASYYGSGQRNQYPKTLAALLEDKRGVNTVRHLRKIYRDPMSNSQDWGLLTAGGGEIMGVYSKADGQPMKQQGFSQGNAQFSGKSSYQDWAFVHTPGQSNSPSTVPVK